ncbi:MAG: hypothetical protein H6Q10_1475 [Acidobacteria bacterium]|nr:hypothetical protein [Acidobacteriota bacterium]
MSVRATYSIGDLAAAAGVSRRTLHFYVQRGLLPPPEGRGRGARYTDDHLARLLQIKGWQEQGLPLEEIRGRLTGDRRAAFLVRREPGAHPGWALVLPGGRPAEPPAPVEQPVSAGAPSAVPDTPGSSWFRQPLVAGFELHVAGGRRPLTAQQLALLARALGDILDNRGEEQ